MTAYSTTLDLHEHNQIKYSNMVSMEPIPCINVNVSQVDICSWITSKGGWANLAVFDIMALVSTYLGQTSLGFPITVAYIMGTVAYYLGNLSSGNSNTECTFV